MIREAHKRDIRDIAAIHRAALPGDLLPRLGDNFLRKVFYPIVVGTDRALVIVHEESGKIGSFIVFVYDGKEVLKEATRRKTALAAHLLVALPSDISLLREVVSVARGFRTDIHRDRDVCLAGVPELYVMATAPGRQSHGLGGELLERGIEILSDKHSQCLVKTSSQAAKKFYEKHQFSEIGLEYRGARQVHLLLRG